MKNLILLHQSAEISKWALAEFHLWELSTMQYESEKKKKKKKKQNMFLVFYANETGKKKSQLCF